MTATATKTTTATKKVKNNCRTPFSRSAPVESAPAPSTGMSTDRGSGSAPVKQLRWLADRGVINQLDREHPQKVTVATEYVDVFISEGAPAHVLSELTTGYKLTPVQASRLVTVALQRGVPS
jgi:hypothetical protein